MSELKLRTYYVERLSDRAISYETIMGICHKLGQPMTDRFPDIGLNSDFYWERMYQGMTLSQMQRKNRQRT